MERTLTVGRWALTLRLQAKDKEGGPRVDLKDDEFFTLKEFVQWAGADGTQAAMAFHFFHAYAFRYNNEHPRALLVRMKCDKGACNGKHCLGEHFINRYDFADIRASFIESMPQIGENRHLLLVNFQHHLMESLPPPTRRGK
jgi:hypothetical protein